MATTVTMSSCCLSGKVHNGTPTGKIETIDNLQTYVAAPADGSRAKTIVFLVDIFGWEFKNMRLLADSYAEAGFYCYLPDVHQGDSVPMSLLQPSEPPLKIRREKTADEIAEDGVMVRKIVMPWMAKHGDAVSRPLISSFISKVRQIPGTGKVGAIGFCWGGRHAILAAHGEVDAAYSCHPSLVTIPEDFEPISVPLSFAVGDADSLLSNDVVDKIQDVMAKTAKAPWELKIYKDQIHGFAVRSDWSSDVDKKAMDDCEKQGVEWFNKYLA